jgi:hypothetical protein
MHHMDASHSDLSPDHRLAALAAKQFGVFDLTDAAGCGFGRGAIASRIKARRWLRVHPRVYALGHAQLTIEGHRPAAIRACGPGAVLSHEDAAAAWGMRPSTGTRFEVTVPGGARRQPDRRNIRVHSSTVLDAGHRTRLGPIPITTVARTLIDIAPRLTLRTLEDAISQADLRGRFDGHEVRAILAAHPTRAGAPLLRTVLDGLEGVGVPRTRSEMEIRFREFCDANGLPQPAVNAIVDGDEVDFRWPGTNVIVETDSWSYHRMPRRREFDATKRLGLEAAGYRVLALTWAQIAARPGPTAAALRQVLRAGLHSA